MLYHEYVHIPLFMGTLVVPHVSYLNAWSSQPANAFIRHRENRGWASRYSGHRHSDSPAIFFPLHPLPADLPISFRLTEAHHSVHGSNCQTQWLCPIRWR